MRQRSAVLPGRLKQLNGRAVRILARLTFALALVLPWLVSGTPASAQFKTTYSNQGQWRGGERGVASGAMIKVGNAMVYPQFRSEHGIIRWVAEQMPLKVYVSRGLTLDGIIDENVGAPVNNVNNINAWPDLLADVVTNPDTFNNLPVAEGFVKEHYQAALEGISFWKAFEPEGIFSIVFVDDPSVADIHVFWVHHFVDKMGLALFSGDIRGYTAKRSFSYKAVCGGGQAAFKPVLIQLRTTESNGQSMPYGKMRAAAAHEFGHALGIEGHSPQPTDLMSLYYGQGVISQTDATTVRYLYRLTPDLIP